MLYWLGVAAFGLGSVATSAPLLGVVAAAVGSYTLVAVSIGFLMGQIGLGQHAANAVANIGGMALSFLGGAWVPIEWLPDSLARAARLTPGYWADQAAEFPGEERGEVVGYPVSWTRMLGGVLHPLQLKHLDHVRQDPDLMLDLDDYQ